MKSPQYLSSIIYQVKGQSKLKDKILIGIIELKPNKDPLASFWIVKEGLFCWEKVLIIIFKTNKNLNNKISEHWSLKLSSVMIKIH